LDADHHHSLRRFLGFFCSWVSVVIEGHTVIPGVKRRLPQMRYQPGCHGVLVLGDRLRQPQDLPAA
jgi:hypothetical protein